MQPQEAATLDGGTGHVPMLRTGPGGWQPASPTVDGRAHGGAGELRAAGGDGAVSGMTRGVTTGNHLVVAAFYSTLLHQLLALFCVVLVAVLCWNGLRTVQYRRALRSGDASAFHARGPGVGEPAARALLRWAFGGFWVLDGLLQLQSSMPLGMASGVFSPAASGAPRWVLDVVQVSVNAWSRHPVTAAAATVWIQVGLGVLVLAAPRGRWSRLSGVAAATWGLVVWVFGEAFGGLFTPGASVLFGLPGAALFYVAAGVLLALPESSWRTASLGRGLLRALGAVFCATAVLQAWPGRGFWQGHATARAGPGLLDQMVTQMSANPQPGPLASVLRWFARLDAAHGFAVNLVVVVVLAAIGLALVVGRRRVLLAGVVAALCFAVVDWVVVQDFGFLGGVGTDPNSMPPIAALLGVGTLGVLRPSAEVSDVLGAVPAPRPRWLDRATPAYLLRLAAAAVAGVVILVGAAPMALAATGTSTDPILARALGDAPQPVDYVAPSFTLTDPSGHTVSLASLRGRVVVLTFLDPVCTTDCPLIAQELATTDRLLGEPRDVSFVAIDANPVFRSASVLAAFDRENALGGLPNWAYVTGPLRALRSVWARYGILARVEPAGAMVDHVDVVYVIDRLGAVRDEFEPALGTTSTDAASFASLLAGTVRAQLGQ